MTGRQYELYIERYSNAEVNNNYRSVRLTNVVCKGMESIIRDHVITYFLIMNSSAIDSMGS